MTWNDEFSRPNKLRSLRRSTKAIDAQVPSAPLAHSQLPSRAKDNEANSEAAALQTSLYTASAPEVRTYRGYHTIIELCR